MEIKVLCACGTKYKFDVEPVNGRMPWPVKCPSCSADGTPQANEIIQQALAATPSAADASPNVEASAASAATAPSPPAGLRINRPAPAPSRAHAAPVPAPAPFTVVRSDPEGNGLTWKVAVIMAVVFLVVGVVGYRWYRRIRAVVNVAVAIHQMYTGTVPGGSMASQNLTADNQVVLYVKHTNQMEVAEACITYWKEKLHRNLTMVGPGREGGNENEFAVMPPHNGYVRIMGSLEWKEPQFEGVAQHLSQKYGTMVFEQKDVSFSGAYVFGVYDRGTNQFHARMDVRMNKDNEPEEIVKTEGNDWAVANGYKPGPGGFKEFSITDANELTKKYGLKLWDENEGAVTNYVVLVDGQMPKGR
jgi:hypothetical protein